MRLFGGCSLLAGKRLGHGFVAANVDFVVVLEAAFVELLVVAELSVESFNIV